MISVRIPAPDFNLKATITSGQVFGFTEANDWFSGQISGKSVELKQTNGSLELRSRFNLVNEVRNYFDLDRDLSPIYQILKSDAALEKTFPVFRGLRLIKQDSWEALACFILSSNNNVKRIQGIWRNLSLRLSSDGVSFPKPHEIARAHERILRELGLGYRAPYLLRSAQFVSTNPESLRFIREATYEEAKEKLLSFPGIGEKVADCVLLYGFQKLEAFPVDIWILRAIRKLYFRGRSVPERTVLRFGQKRWKEYAGYIQQYVFHSARMGIL